MTDELYRARVRKKTLEIHSPDNLLKELGAEFGRRLAMAEKQGIPILAAFESLKINFRETGKMMVYIADTVTAEQIEELPNGKNKSP